MNLIPNNQPKELYSLEAEQAAIGGMLIDSEKIDDIQDFLFESDFYSGVHRFIYSYLLRMNKEKKSIDIITLAEEMDQDDKLELIGGFNYLASLADGVASANNLKRYAEIIVEKQSYRKIEELNEELSLSNGKVPLRVLLEKIQQEKDRLEERLSSSQDSFVCVKDALMKNVEHLQEMYSREDIQSTPHLPTGLIDLDAITNGLERNSYNIIAGRPGMGKTALAMGIMEHNAIKEKTPVAIFSMEMSIHQLVNRLLSSVGKIDSNKLKTANFNDNDWEKLSVAMGKLNEAPIYIDETPSLKISELRSRSKKLKRKIPDLGLIVIDYFQLLRVGENTAETAAELSEISKGLMALTKEIGVPLLVLSQLNRELERRTDKRPIMSDLKGSGSQEQDAHLILFIYRDEIYNPDTEDKGIAEIIVGKQRNGAQGTIRTAFLGENTKFENLSRPFDSYSH